MRVFKRGNTYFYEFEFNGKRYRKNTRCRSYSDAMRVAQSAQPKVEAAESQYEFQSSCPTLIEFRDQFLARIDSEHRSSRTSQTYRQGFNKLAEHKAIADKPLSEITDGDVAEFMRFLMEKQLSNATVNHYVAFLKIVLRSAMDAGIVHRLPAIPRKLKCETRAPYVFGKGEYHKWLSLCPDPLKTMSVLARRTGMRLGEMLSLRKEDVTLLSEPDSGGFWGNILVHRERRHRLLKISRQVRDLLHSHISRSKCEFVFTSLRDNAKALKRVGVYAQVKNVKSRGDFPTGAGLHALRFTFFVGLCEVADPFTVAKIAGHSLLTTMRCADHTNVNWEALRKLQTEGSEEE